MVDLPLTKLAETTSTITLGWTPIPCLGYVLYADGVRKSNSWDPLKSSWKTNKATEIKVVALGAAAEGVYPPVVVPPPSNRLVLTGSLSQMFAQAAAARVPCVVPTGTYSYGSWLTIPNVDILFDRVTLLPTNPGSSSLRITGSGTKVTFQGVCRIGAVGARNPRYNNGTACAIEVHDATDSVFHADDLVTEGMAGNALLSWGANSRFTLTGKWRSVWSGSDSFHISNSATDIDLVGATLTSDGSGDDCFAVVSYLGSPAVSGVRWGTVIGRNQQWGRGFTVVGGTNVTVESVDLDGTAGAGIYIACEPEYNTCGVDGVVVKAAKVRRPNTKGIHGANVVVYSSNPPGMIANVTVTVDPDPAFATWQRTGSGSVSNVKVNGQTVT